MSLEFGGGVAERLKRNLAKIVDNVLTGSSPVAIIFLFCFVLALEPTWNFLLQCQ
jgi:hypothetical protein